MENNIVNLTPSMYSSPCFNNYQQFTRSISYSSHFCFAEAFQSTPHVVGHFIIK